jgi:hypothetical protein
MEKIRKVNRFNENIIEKMVNKVLKEEYYESRKPVDGYVDADELIGQHLWVHTNRTHRNQGKNGMIGIYGVSRSGRRTGSPLNYTNEIRIVSPIYFETSESGAKRIRKSAEEGELKRTLIAGVSGIVVPTEGNLKGFEQIDYDPINVGHFFRIGDPDMKEVIGASEVYFKASELGQWVMLAKDIEYRV